MNIKTNVAIGIFTGAALFTAPAAGAVTAYMDGLANVGPGWSTITMPDGSKCGADCKEVKWNYWSTGGYNGSTAAAGKWMDAHNTPDAVLYSYSLSAVGANEARALRPDWQGKIVELGSPARPGSGANTREGGRPLLVVGGGNVEYLSTEGDEAAVRTKAWGGTHLTGYKNRDFSQLTPVAVTQYGPNVIDRVYPDPPKVVKPFNPFDISTWFQKPTTKTTITKETVNVQPTNATPVVAASRVDGVSEPTSVPETPRTTNADRADAKGSSEARSERVARHVERQADREAKKADREAKREARTAKRNTPTESANDTSSAGSDSE